MPKFSKKLNKQFEEKAYEIRMLAIKLISKGNLSHPGDLYLKY